MLDKLDFQEDECGINEYLNKRIKKSEISTVVHQKDEFISPETYADLLKCPATSVEVERSF